MENLIRIFIHNAKQNINLLFILTTILCYNKLYPDVCADPFSLGISHTPRDKSLTVPVSSSFMGKTCY